MTIVDTILQLWPILTLVVYVLMGWLLWHLSKSFISRKEHNVLKDEVENISAQVSKKYDALKGEMEEVGSEVAKIHGRLESLPAAQEMNSILLGLEEVRGTQRELIATMKGQNEVLKRIEHPVQLLMSEAIKKGTRHGG